MTIEKIYLLPTADSLVGDEALIICQKTTDKQISVDTFENYLNRDTWDDLRFPAQGINPPGTEDAPTRNTTTGLLEFSGTADNIIAGVAQMPHAWHAGTEIRPHIHLLFPTAATANTKWRLDYDVASVHGNFTNAYGTFTQQTAITVANPNSAKKHVIASFAPIDMTGFTESCVVMWKITRLASSDAQDDDTGACALLEFDIHYQINKRGTADEIPS